MKARGAALIGSLVAAAAAAGATRIRANDLWWHLETGEWIASHAQVPRIDPFSFTSAGIPWVDHGWLWQILAWSIHSLAGAAGLIGLKILCGAAVVVLGWLALRRASWSPHAAALVCVVALAGLRFRLSDRPEAAGLALAALFLFGLAAPGLRPGARILIALGATIPWANMHASVLLAPVLAGASAAGGLLAWALGRRRELPDAVLLLAGARLDLRIAVVSTVSLLITPYGTGLLAVPSRLGGALSDPRLVNPEWLPPRLDTFPLFAIALAGILILSALRIVRRREGEAWRVLFMAGLVGALALSSARHVGFFFAVLPFLLAIPGARTFRDAGVDGGVGEAGRFVSGLLPARWAPAWGLAAALVFLLVPDPRGAPPGLGPEPGRFPEGEADFVERAIPAPRNLYNDVAHGGYLIWRFHPGDRVFIDGRNEVHAALLGRIAGALDDGRAWQALLEAEGVRTALVRYRPERIPIAGSPPGEARSFAPLHFPKSRWALVHWGDAAMVFVRRTGPFRELIAREEYRFAHPEDWEYQLERCRGGDLDLLDGILGDLRRRQAEGPPSSRAEALLKQFGRLRAG